MVGGPAPNWPEIDRTVERIKARERSKPRLVETARVVEHGFFPMSDEDYAAALEVARVDVRKENPKLADSEVEAEAIKRADEAKRRYENSFSSRASSTYEWKVP